MKLEGQHQFDAAPTEVWRALHDAQILANALPGVRSLELQGEDLYAVTVTVGLGAVKGIYSGTFSLTEQRPPESCVVVARAGGPPGTVSATASMRLAEEGASTLLSYEADATVTGPLAGVGQRMVAAAARKTTREFFDAVDRELAAGPVAATPAEPTAPAGGGTEADRQVVTRARALQAGSGRELRLLAGGFVLGAAAALAGVAFGRRAARS